MSYFQAGDVLLHECSKPMDVTKLDTDILYQGINHTHRVRGKFKIGKTEDGTVFLHSKGCQLFHDEHRDIDLPEGFYRLGIVKEYDHFLEESRNIID